MFVRRRAGFVFMRHGRFRCRILVNLGFEDQGRHAPLLQRRHAGPCDESGKKRSEENPLKQSHDVSLV
jgi:hypothetical protein